MDGFTIDEDFVRALVREQHPDLAELSLREVDGGWDNRLWRLGEELAVRIPLTPRAPSLLRNEYRWLPVLASRLPLPVPAPVRIGEPSARFPRPWTIAAWVPGEPADRTPIARADHAADGLARFLRALHQDAPADAPAGAIRGVPLNTLTLDPDERFRAADRARQVWDEAVSAPEWQGRPVWLHGDLHPANVVVADGTLAGVLDFGDMCAGDPATDLSAAWVLLPEGAAGRFLTAYGDVDEATIRRAKGWAVLRGMGLIDIGRAGELGQPGGKVTWGPAGRAAIDRVLASA
ncbi:aminoglycoside phosphotransferase family protein [Actinomadura sp. DC4]|uniref:aminoglycoside phosphotransferase family protein n=1 Tax=Actinomadura sp. DC4 TaxID=3055069 RepID=UPI0025AEE64B|nr:aminoglycoside phosphotransferase family protein [Actinomadura sp. DC4]MDN3353964.1 aminoglycoside phosphotransferase family protein [Actinomadura sp. DC4]